MKNFIVSILEPILSLFVVIYTLFGFVAGGLLGGFGLFGGDFNLIGALLGGFVFFLIAVIGTGAIFTLLAIRDLLEEQVELLEAKQTNDGAAPVEVLQKAYPDRRWLGHA